MPLPIRCTRIRETPATFRGRTIIIETHPAFLVTREKGTRRRYAIDYATLHELVMMRDAKRTAGDVPARRRRRS